MTVKKNEQQNPAEVAREAFKRLATRRIAPTPDAYRDIYDEIVGTAANMNAETVLTRFATAVMSEPSDIGDYGVRLNRAVQQRDWEDYAKALKLLFEEGLKQPEPIAPKIPDLKPPSKPSTPIETRGSLVDAAPQDKLLRELLTRTLSFALPSLLVGAPELAKEAEELGLAIKDAPSEGALTEAGTRLKQLCFKIELKSGDLGEQQELLMRLFKLLLENVKELLDDDSWLAGQVANVQDLLAGPVNSAALKDATRALKEVIYKQGVLKNSLSDAKVTVKQMMLTFIDRLSAVAATTSDYHDKIDSYASKISQAKDITELNRILEDVMRDTRLTQEEALRTKNDMVAARQEVHDAETRIHELESKLQEMSQLVREDQLTGAQNRRGLDDTLEREMARAERRKTPLCIAMIDLDNFKKLNDTYGHSAGDEALILLVRVVKDTLRSMDVVARYGGEEFMLVLPDTPVDSAVDTVTRVQRELTKRIFMYNNEQIFVTFSSGVALLQQGEDQASLVRRADEALYKAKRAGKNRVIAAD